MAKNARRSNPALSLDPQGPAPTAPEGDAPAPEGDALAPEGDAPEAPATAVDPAAAQEAAARAEVAPPPPEAADPGPMTPARFMDQLAAKDPDAAAWLRAKLEEPAFALGLMEKLLAERPVTASKDLRPALRITAVSEHGFWRAKRKFTKTPTTVYVDELKPEELAAIRATARLHLKVEEILA